MAVARPRRATGVSVFDHDLSGGLRPSKRRRSLAVAFSVAAHAAALVALVSIHSEPPKTYEPRLMTLMLIDLPKPKPPPKPAPPLAEAEPAPADPPPRKASFRPSPPRPDVAPLPAGKDKTTSPGVEVSDAQLAGAATAGSGGAGGVCNMPRWLQSQLRKDARVQAAVAEVHRGKAIMVWNGDWVRREDQEGAGLAAVREAMMWEIGFAPEACRALPVHGLVMLSLNDGPGAPRIVVGAGVWRWSDLLFSRAASPAGASLQ